jgi:DNA-directed RNA polymerase subunit M/transcription elongation factor TFIIS
MDSVDRVQQWRQVTEHYRALTDDELIGIARQKEDLTEIAQQALAAEISSRKLEVPPEERAAEQKAPVFPEPDPDSPYEAERELVEIEVVYSLRDALQLQTLLDGADIPFCMGEEKATRAEAVRSNFASGVSVKIMRIGLPYASGARRAFQPEDDPGQAAGEERPEDLDADSVFCPKCHSQEVVLLEVEADRAKPELASTFGWTCDACGHQWEDDGVMGEE